MMKKLLMLSCLAIIFSSCSHIHHQSKAMKYGSVIILNGPSASGKSSIQKAWQNLKMPELWLKLGIDNLFDFPMPDITPDNLSYWQSPNNIRWVSITKDNLGKSIVNLHVGKDGEKVMLAMNSAIKAYVEHGLNVIVDYIAYNKTWFSDLEHKLAPYRVFYVAVDISLAELERREAKRKTSPTGHARSHYQQVYWDKNYDLRVNSEDESPEQIAKKIAKLLDG